MGPYVVFAPNIGVIIKEPALKLSPKKLHSLVVSAFSHMRDTDLVEACCGGCGPLAGTVGMKYEDYLRHLGIHEPPKNVKRISPKIKHGAYNAGIY